MKSATVPHRGMLADNLLKMRGRSAFAMVADPSLLGRDEKGYIIAWHYADCDVILSYWERGVRVREIVPLKEVG